MSVRATNTGESSFTIETGSGHSITLSGMPENQGPRPMEMLLVGLAGCAGVGILSILRKMRQNVTNYEVRVRGERADTDPKVFTTIYVEHIFTGSNLQAESIQRAIDLDTTDYCGANVMLSTSATIKHSFQIKEASA
ncbi:OsmC family peroxiredoxin [Ktedonosporobacter rubrisoli]|uniref:OsmC family peroxiredoxin n=2 Tax=Ktedonosporobacter rubrisoli TaxID=2509675 RepID=A0A4P6K5H4_KTERU|nr:OsmC family peroxiredoxin [Ktedonosporobacter rubrisoli]